MSPAAKSKPKSHKSPARKAKTKALARKTHKRGGGPDQAKPKPTFKNMIANIFSKPGTVVPSQPPPRRQAWE
jgi:hypothetical protein